MVLHAFIDCREAIPDNFDGMPVWGVAFLQQWLCSFLEPCSYPVFIAHVLNSVLVFGLNNAVKMVMLEAACRSLN